MSRERCRVGLFGGSFDPIHYGHILPVEGARKALELERVIYLPTARPPHKPERSFAPAYARYAMVELALLNAAELRVSPHEMVTDRPSYTVESLEHFRDELPDCELFLLIGGDAFAELPTWKRWRDLPELAELVVMVRPGWDLAHLRDELDPDLIAAVDRGRVHFVANPPVEIAATGLREMISRGAELPRGAVPDLVLKYIRKYDLYR